MYLKGRKTIHLTIKPMHQKEFKENHMGKRTRHDGQNGAYVDDPSQQSSGAKGFKLWPKYFGEGCLSFDCRRR